MVKVVINYAALITRIGVCTGKFLIICIRKQHYPQISYLKVEFTTFTDHEMGLDLLFAMDDADEVVETLISLHYFTKSQYNL